jgi:transposase
MEVKKLPRKLAVAVTDDEMIEVYRQCGSAEKAAEKIGVSATTVSRVLVKNNIERSGLKRYRLSMTEAPKNIGVPYMGSSEEIIELYKSGLSMRQIAKKIGRSVHVVANRVRRAGIARPFHGTGPEHSQWKGERIEAGDGYWKVWIAPDDPLAIMRGKAGYVKEQRLVMARELGRPLRDYETVHHIDGNRSHNDICNLQLRIGAHGKHERIQCAKCGSHEFMYVPLS